MRNHLERLGHPDAISWVTMLGALVVMVPSAFLTSMVDASGRELGFLGLILVRVAVTAAVLAAGWVALQTFARTKPRPFITLVSFLVVIVAATAVFDGLLVTYGFTAESMLPRRLAITLVGTLSALILSSLMICYARDYSRSNVELRATVEQLQRQRAEAGERIESRKAELIDTIKSKINVELEKVDGSRRGANAAVMQTLIDDVVRPLSYSLNRDFDSDANRVVVPPDRTIDWTVVVQGALESNPFRWIGLPVVIGLISTPFLIVNFGAVGVLTAAAFLGVIVLVMGILAWCWKFMPQRVPVGARALIFSLTHIPGAILSTWVTERLSGFPLSETSQVFGFLVISLVFSWSVTLVTATFRLLRESNSQLKETVDDLRRELIAINTSYRQLNKGISRVLHGPLQEAITSAMLRLHAHPDHLSEPGSAEMIWARINQALELLSKPAATEIDVSRALEDLSELWGGVVKITHTVSRENLAQIESDSSASYALVEVVREACANAIRHGGAKAIHIRVVAVNHGRAIELVVDNDGESLPTKPRLGIGSQIFDEQTLDWGRTQVGDTVRLTARLPLTPQPGLEVTTVARQSST